MNQVDDDDDVFVFYVIRLNFKLIYGSGHLEPSN
jgi:hypothetical protein